MTGQGASDEDERDQFFAYAPNTGVVFAAGQVGGQPPAEPAYVKLMPDYSADIPLWGIPWTDLHLDQTLIGRLRAWQSQFDDHFHYERAGTTPTSRPHGESNGTSLRMRSAPPSVLGSRSALIRGLSEPRASRT